VPSSGSVFTTTADWYKRPPKGLNFDSVVRLPHHLTVSVPTLSRQEATVLLGTADAIALTGEQVARFGVTIDADAVLCARIDAVKEKLQFFQEHPVDEELSRRFGKRAFDEMREREQTIMNDMRSEIKQLSHCEHLLKPYLIKAVVLQCGGTFNATLAGKDLIVGFDAMGAHGVPMERCPVIAFLPTKPRHVYTTVSMTRWGNRINNGRQRCDLTGFTACLLLFSLERLVFCVWPHPFRGYKCFPRGGWVSEFLNRRPPGENPK
jgi:hypothetical protein